MIHSLLSAHLQLKPAYKTHTIQNKSCFKWQKSLQSSLSGDVIALLFKRTEVSSLLRHIFPCPLNHHLHKIHFSSLMSEGLFAGTTVILSFRFFSLSSLFYLYSWSISTFLSPILGLSSLNHWKPCTQTWGLVFHYVAFAHQFA